MVDVTRLYDGTVGRGGMLIRFGVGVALISPPLLLLVQATCLVPVPHGVTAIVIAAGLGTLVWLPIVNRRRLQMISEAVDATHCSIVVYDANDRLILANRRYRDVLGVPAGAIEAGMTYRTLIRRSLETYLPPDAVEDELVERNAIHARGDGRPSDRQYPNNRWERVTKTRLPNGLNVGIAIDVSEYYALRDQLDTEARRFAALARGAPVGICLVDGAGQLQFVNDALLTMMGAADRQALLAANDQMMLRDTAVRGFGALISELRQTASDTEVRLEKGGETYHMMVRKAYAPIAGSQPDGPDAAENLLIFVDITTRKKAEAKVSYLALHDPLTGALNRVAFAEDLERASGGADLQHPAALIAIDLDRFKPVNDVHGHAVGDVLLCRVVERIGEAIAADCRLYRIGGDEFAVLCPPPTGANAMAFARAILDRLTEPFTVEGYRILIGASVGVSSLPSDTDNPQTLIHYADLALYQGKNRGGGSVHAFSPAVLSSADTRRVMELELAEAVENGDIEIMMQPIVGTERKVAVAAECLARWTNRRTGEAVPPSTFIPVAEAANLIVRLDVLILHKALATYAALAAAGTAPQRLMVNVSVRTLEEPGFAGEVRTALARNALPGSSIVLEVTENFLVDDAHKLGATMQQIAALGVHFALDDFGTGFTTLRMLADLPITYLKIDQSFVRDLDDPHRQRQHRVIRAIIDLASHLELDVIAEGVETEAAYETLRGLGCGLFQGYLFARPLRPEAFAKGTLPQRKGSAAA